MSGITQKILQKNHFLKIFKYNTPNSSIPFIAKVWINFGLWIWIWPITIIQSTFRRIMLQWTDFGFLKTVESNKPSDLCSLNLTVSKPEFQHINYLTTDNPSPIKNFRSRQRYQRFPTTIQVQAINPLNGLVHAFINFPKFVFSSYITDEVDSRKRFSAFQLKCLTQWKTIPVSNIIKRSNLLLPNWQFPGFAGFGSSS